MRTSDTIGVCLEGQREVHDAGTIVLTRVMLLILVLMWMLFLMLLLLNLVGRRRGWWIEVGGFLLVLVVLELIGRGRLRFVEGVLVGRRRSSIC